MPRMKREQPRGEPIWERATLTREGEVAAATMREGFEPPQGGRKRHQGRSPRWKGEREGGRSRATGFKVLDEEGTRRHAHFCCYPRYSPQNE